MGVDVQPWGGVQFFFNRRDRAGVGYTVWNPFQASTKYFEPSDKPFMLNLRVDDLEAMLAQLREAGARVLVFSRSSGAWRVVWRTLQTEPAAPSDVHEERV